MLSVRNVTSYVTNSGLNGILNEGHQVTMVPSGAKILTWHPSGRSGVYIARKDYERISSFILSVLKSNELTMKDLLDRAEMQMAHEVNCTPWNLLIVKLDLEARGLIRPTSKFSPGKSPFLKLRPGALKKFKSIFYPGLNNTSL